MITIRRILCPTDLSPASDEALPLAIALARAYEAKLFVCHCLEVTPLADASGREEIKRLYEDSIKDHLHYDRSDAPDWEAIVVEGDPAAAIAGEAAGRGADLIVMRSRRQPHAAALLGSTAEAVCRVAPCPVLVTHPREREWAGSVAGGIELKRILAAHDFSGHSDVALSYALSLAQEYQAELHLIHVLPPRTEPDTPEYEWLRPGDEGGFQQAVRRLKNAIPAEAYLWCEVKQVVREGKPYREVLAYAAEQDIDLICLGVRGAGSGWRALFGSNADRVLRRAPCPVLIARPLTPREQGGGE